MDEYMQGSNSTIVIPTGPKLSKRSGSVWNCLWGNALKRSPGIIRMSRVSYPIPGFLSSATWLFAAEKAL